MHALRSNLAQMAKMVADGKATCRLGTVSSYDPDNYAVKVKVQPSDVETGWLPVGAMWAGPGWGMFCPPSAGNQAMVFFQEADELVGICGFVLFSDGDRPLSVPSGEFWLVHQSGTYLKLTNDTNAALNVVGDLAVTVGGDATWNVAGKFTVTASEIDLNGPVETTNTVNTGGDLAVQGGISATADVVAGDGSSLESALQPG